MTMFVVAAVLLVLCVLALLLVPLLGRRSGHFFSLAPPATAATSDAADITDLTDVTGTAAAVTANLAVLREQSRQLEADYAAGLLAAPEHATARMELARRALEESPQGSATAPARPAAGQAGLSRRSRPTALLLGVLLPVLAAGMYLRLGTPEALDTASVAAAPDGGGASGEVTMAQVEAMVSTMAERLEKMPPGQADPAGWEMLARSLASLQRYPEADRAYARAIELAPRNAQLLADRADLLTLLQGRNSVGEPTRLIEQALQLEPDNLKALALAGSAAFERQDFAAALKYWSRARALASPGSDFADGLDRSLEAARSGAGSRLQLSSQTAAPTSAPASAPARADSSAGNSSAQTAGAAGLSGSVSIAPALRSRLQPGDTLFIFARAAQGPRMPLAILRLQAKDLPAKFTLDDSLAMSAELKLSRFEQVVVQARISRSGNALPQAGDLTGQSGPVKPGDRAVRLTIDQVQP
jgi:cytochrome c-type biogenesis protein CcmH